MAEADEAGDRTGEAGGAARTAEQRQGLVRTGLVPPLRPRMTSWFNPGLLARTAVRVAVSTVFGQMADKREALAAANAIEPATFDPSFDYSRRADADGDFWFDYLADTGDGWNPSYAMARLLAQEAIVLPAEEGAEAAPAEFSGPQGPLHRSLARATAATQPAPALDVPPARRPAYTPLPVPGRIEPQALPRGSLLILGGDQVYPTASREDYARRFRAPFETAAERAPGWPKGEARPDLYAIPGNHDWYDGLNSFFGLFCRRRIKAPMSEPRDGAVIAGRQTKQSRSYFAIRLPGDWWVWGTDSQLEGYIDQPQVDFFDHVARHWMEEGSRLILCVGEPAWVYADRKAPGARFASFAYLERLVERCGRGHRLRVVLTGDSHHYARYEEVDGGAGAAGGELGSKGDMGSGGDMAGGDGRDVPHDEVQMVRGSLPRRLQSRRGRDDLTIPSSLQSRHGRDFPRHYIVCGGGGAFLHPTSQLGDRAFAWESGRPGSKEREGPKTRDFRLARTFPGKGASRLLALRNLLFPVLNPAFTAFLFCAYALFEWTLHFNAQMLAFSFPDALAEAGSLREAAAVFWQVAMVSPWPAMLLGLAAAGYVGFADARTGRGKAALGLLHWTAQTATVLAVTWAVMRLTAGAPAIDTSALPAGASVDGMWVIQDGAGLVPEAQWPDVPLAAWQRIALASAAAALASSLLFGLYLMLSLLIGGRHGNEAFSALRIQGWKSMLRMRVRGEDGALEIYPIGLRRVPREWPRAGMRLRDGALRAERIEGVVVVE